MEEYDIQEKYKAAIQQHQAGNLREAELSYKEILEQSPENYTILSFLGLLYYQSGLSDLAISCISKAVSISPDPAYYRDLGDIYFDLKAFDKAIDSYLQVIKLAPNEIALYSNLAMSYYAINDLDNAVFYYKKAVEINPSNADTCFNLGLALHKQKKYNEAAQYYRQSLTLNPNLAEGYVNLGNACQQINDINGALDCYSNGLALFPDHPMIAYDRGCLLLKTGKFEEGWKYFEYRTLLYPHHKLKFPVEKYPKWEGQPFDGKTIYVYHASAEFGFGDTIMFARYLSLLNSLGANVICKPQSGLEKLFKESNLKSTILDRSDIEVSFDYQIPIMSLPYAFKTNFDNIPYSCGYLKANKEKSEYYKNKFFNNNKLKVAIVWLSGLKTDNRSIPLEYLDKITELNDVEVYSLQKGEITANTKIIDLGITFEDFSDTAAAIENFDLVISIDTSVAHLAGALGKKTYVLLPHIADWKWFSNTEKSPWYDSIRLFRQTTEGDWSGVIEMVKASIKDKL